MLERYLCKVGVSSCSRLDRGSTDSFISEARMRSKIHTVITDTVPSQNKLVRLSSAQKCFIAQYEQVELRKDIKQFAETCDDLLDEYLACVEKLRLMQEHSSKERKLFEKRVAAAIRKPAVFGDGHRVLLRYHRTYLKRLKAEVADIHLSMGMFSSAKDC
ncbi:unnamed protein product [Dicrocoelium dendriticum]|nr:unnamed protein product [Dicrocoelium dendriticum]